LIHIRAAISGASSTSVSTNSAPLACTGRPPRPRLRAVRAMKMMCESPRVIAGKGTPLPIRATRLREFPPGQLPSIHIS
jgi:hypothetical protein